MKRATKRSGRVAKRVPLAQQLDKAVEKIMGDRESKPARVSSSIAAILRIASDLRDLPTEDFKAQLKRIWFRERRLLQKRRATFRRVPYCECMPGGARCTRAIEFYKEAFRRD